MVAGQPIDLVGAHPALYQLNREDMTLAPVLKTAPTVSKIDRHRCQRHWVSLETQLD